MNTLDFQNFPLRTACKCGSSYGRIEVKSGQNSVRCIACGVHQYNAPKAETGENPRSLTSSRDSIKPAKRASILARDNFRCVTCGRGAGEGTILHIGHLVSVQEGLEAGLTVEEIDGEDNLAVMCETCNLGFAKRSMPFKLVVTLLKRRTNERSLAAFGG